MNDRLKALSDAGVSIWLDDLSRERLETGNLAELVQTKNVVGVTSNPRSSRARWPRASATTPRCASSPPTAPTSTAPPSSSPPTTCARLQGHAPGLRRHRRRRRPRLDRGLPRARALTDDTVTEAATLYKTVGEPNVMIKIPGTKEGWPAITETIAAGHLGQRDADLRSRAVPQTSWRPTSPAWRRRRQRPRARRHPLGRLVLRLARRLRDRQAPRRHHRGPRHRRLLKGKAGVANARLAFKMYEEFFSGPAGRRSRPRACAQAARPLWASTGVEEPRLRRHDVRRRPRRGEHRQHHARGHPRGRRRPRRGPRRPRPPVLRRRGGPHGRRSPRPASTTTTSSRCCSRRASTSSSSPGTSCRPRSAHRSRLPVVSKRPVDATSTPAWAELSATRTASPPTCAAGSTRTPSGSPRSPAPVGDLHVDLSKTFLHGQLLEQLLELAEQTGACWSAATRCSPGSTSTSPRTARCCTPRSGCRLDATLEVDGQDVVARSTRCWGGSTLRRQVRSGAWTGVTGRRIATVVNIGIGGSTSVLMAYEALAPYRQDGLTCRFISNIDPTDAAQSLEGLDPETTLFIVSARPSAPWRP